LFNFYLFLSFSLGIIAGYYFPFPSLKIFFALFSLFSLYFSYKRGKEFYFELFSLFCFFFLGTLWMPYKLDIQKFLNRKHTFIIKVVSIPQSKPLYQKYTSLINQIEGRKVNLKVFTFDYSLKKEYLSFYTVKGKLILRKYRNRKFLYLVIAKEGTEQKKTPVLSLLSSRLTFQILRKYRKYLSLGVYQFLSGIFLGRRELMPLYIKKIFKEAGLSHILAISGLHVGIISGFLFFILRFFYIKFRMRIIASVVFLYLYSFLVGFNPSTFRATIMYTVFFMGFFLRRKVHPLNSLGIAGLILEFMNPYLVFDIGFQLSFISVFAIIFGYRFFKIKIKARNYFLFYFKHIFFSSLFVNIFIFPLLLYYFGRVNLLNILENFIVIPLLSLIISVNLLFLLSPAKFLSSSLGAILSFIGESFLRMIDVFSSFKFLKIEASFSLILAGIWYLFLFIIFLFIYKFRRGQDSIEFF